MFQKAFSAFLCEVKAAEALHRQTVFAFVHHIMLKMHEYLQRAHRISTIYSIYLYNVHKCLSGLNFTYTSPYLMQGRVSVGAACSDNPRPPRRNGIIYRLRNPAQMSDSIKLIDKVRL